LRARQQAESRRELNAVGECGRDGNAGDAPLLAARAGLSVWRTGSCTTWATPPQAGCTLLRTLAVHPREFRRTARTANPGSGGAGDPEAGAPERGVSQHGNRGRVRHQSSTGGIVPFRAKGAGSTAVSAETWKSRLRRRRLRKRTSAVMAACLQAETPGGGVGQCRLAGQNFPFRQIP